MELTPDIIARLPGMFKTGWTDGGLNMDYLNRPGRFFPLGTLIPVTREQLKEHVTYTEFWEEQGAPLEVLPALVNERNRGVELDQVAQEVKNMIDINIERLKLLLLRHFIIVLGEDGQQRLMDIREMLQLPSDAH